MAMDVLRQIHTMSGVDFVPTNTHMNTAMNRFKELRVKKAEERKKANTTNKPVKTEDSVVYEEN
jgi:hypothetical protein